MPWGCPHLPVQRHSQCYYRCTAVRSFRGYGLEHQVGSEEEGNCHIFVHVSSSVSELHFICDNQLDPELKFLTNANPRVVLLLRCPITTIPSMMETEFLYESSDFTWQAVAPTVWLQISYNLAVITACIPTMKNVFDSMSGNFTAEIDAPYKLTALTGAGNMGFEALDQAPSQARSHLGSQGSSLKLHTAAPNQAACFATDGRRRNSKRAGKDDESKSESVQNLTDGVVLVTEEVNVQFEDDRPSSALGSYGSWDSSHHRITGT